MVTHIYHVLCCKWFNHFFLCKQRSTDSTDHLILALPCCPEHRGWSYHLQRDVFAEWPPPAVRTVIYCAALPPPKHEPDIWWVKLGQAHWHLPFLFYNLWDNNHWDTPQSRGKEWQKQCFFTGLHFKQKKLNWGTHMAWNTANIIKHHQTSSNYIHLLSKGVHLKATK